MLPITALTTVHLSAASKGDFFMPRDPGGGDRFLVGDVNTRFPVGVNLDGNQFLFSDLPALNRRGFIVAGCQFMVDPESSAPLRHTEEEHVPLGALILYGQDAAVLSVSRHGTKALVSIAGEAIPEDADATAFTKWSVVVRGVGDVWQELYSFGDGVEGWLNSMIG